MKNFDSYFTFFLYEVFEIWGCTLTCSIPPFTLATFQVPSSPTWLVASVPDSAGIDLFESGQKNVCAVITFRESVLAFLISAVSLK